MKLDKENIIGLVPAAGEGKSIQPVPFSKEMFPIKIDEDKNKVKIISCFLMEQFEKANIDKAIFVIKSGKWDIPKFWGEQNPLAIRLGFIVIGNSKSIPETIDNAFPFIKNNIVAFGFPDLIIEPDNVYMALLQKLGSSKANIILGLFPVENPSKFDMVLLDDNEIIDIHTKPALTDLKYAWCLAVWDQEFTEFIHRWFENPGIKTSTGELQLSNTIMDFVKSGGKINTVVFEKGQCFDIGTIADLEKAVKIQNKN